MPRKYLLALLVITIIFFGGIFLLIRFIAGGDDNTAQPSTSQKINKLSTNGTQVSYTVYGKVVGEEQRRAIKITINDTMRKLEILQGYDENVVTSSTFPNKSSSFDALLLALEGAGFTSRDTSIKTDGKSLCPLGNRYVFEAQFEEGANVQSFSNSCSTKNVSFKGNKTTVEKLFEAQIPDYTKLTKEVRL